MNPFAKNNKTKATLVIGIITIDSKERKKEISEATNLAIESVKNNLESKGVELNILSVDKTSVRVLFDHLKKQEIKWKEDKAISEFTSDINNYNAARLQAEILKSKLEVIEGEYFTLSDVAKRIDETSMVELFKSAKVPFDGGAYKLATKYLNILQAFNFVSKYTEDKKDFFSITISKHQLLLHVQNIREEWESELKKIREIEKQIKKEAAKEEKLKNECLKLVEDYIKSNEEKIKEFKPITQEYLKIMKDKSKEIVDTRKKNEQIIDDALAVLLPKMEKKGMKRFDIYRLVFDQIEYSKM